MKEIVTNLTSLITNLGEFLTNFGGSDLPMTNQRGSVTYKKGLITNLDDNLRIFGVASLMCWEGNCMSKFLGVGPAEFPTPTGTQRFNVQNFFPKSIIKVNSQRFQRQIYLFD